MHWLYYFLLVGFLLVGLGVQLLALPGLWLMVAATATYAWLTWPAHIGPWTLGIVFALAFGAEVTEFLAGSAGAKAAGGTKRAMIGAIAGGVLGGLLLSFLIPIPVLGSLVGVCIGAFAGASGIELLIHRRPIHSARVGFGAAKGALMGVIAKICFGCVIFLIVAWQAFPWHWRKTTTQPAVVAPTTLPATP